MVFVSSTRCSSECFVCFGISIFYVFLEGQFGLNVSPNISGNGFMAGVMLSIFKFNDLEYSAGFGVNKVLWVLCVFNVRFLGVAQVEIVLRFGWIKVSAIL